MSPIRKIDGEEYEREYGRCRHCSSELADEGHTFEACAERAEALRVDLVIQAMELRLAREQRLADPDSAGLAAGLG